jgi:chitin disaccharide deacetylase
MPSKLILCADDFGLHHGVSCGILELLTRGRIDATSVLVTHDAWRPYIPALHDCCQIWGAEVGLHLNLTEGRPLTALTSLVTGTTFPGLKQLLFQCFWGSVLIEELEAEIEAQLDAFCEAFGHLPHFIDGHQHVHVLPRVRAALFRVLKRHQLAGLLWLRDPSDKWRAIVKRPVPHKAGLVKLFALGFAKTAFDNGFKTNIGFSGFSAFDETRNMDADMTKQTLALGQRPLMMVHPGYAPDFLQNPLPDVRPNAGIAPSKLSPSTLPNQEKDPLQHTRVMELMYLSSARFEDVLSVITEP